MSHADHASPPPEAYSRVTNPERFRPLHAAALDLVKQLEREFAVDRTEAYDLDGALGQAGVDRPGIRLAPAGPTAAPLVFVFSNFPGLLLRFGRCATTAFPICGCDACDAQPGQEIERLEALCADVAAGRFRERIRAYRGGRAVCRWEVWSGSGRQVSESTTLCERAKSPGSTPDVLRFWRIGRTTRVDWAAWPRRGG